MSNASPTIPTMTRHARTQPRLPNLLVLNRNFALLWAKDMKADIVAVVDDDNIPLKGWGEDLLVGREV